MTKEFLTFIKLYVGSMFDIVLFSVAAWDGVDRGLRTISGIGAVVMLVYLIRKHIQDYKVQKIEQAIKELQLAEARKKKVKTKPKNK